jgi:hypothetical protein
MSLVRYGTHVFDLDDVYGLDLYGDDDSHKLRIVLSRGDDLESFKLYFDSEGEARDAFDRICDELDVRDISPSTESISAAATG